MARVERSEEVDLVRPYRLLGVRWYGDGLFVKAVKPGHEIQATRLFRVQEGDFVYSRLFAWKGSFAVAGPAEDGCYVSNEFPTYVIDREAVDPAFLVLLFRNPAIWAEALGLSEGATPTSRNRLSEERFLAMEVPVPDMEVQRKVAALAGKLRQGKLTQGRQEQLMAGLESSLLNYAVVGAG